MDFGSHEGGLCVEDSRWNIGTVGRILERSVCIIRTVWHGMERRFNGMKKLGKLYHNECGLQMCLASLLLLCIQNPHNSIDSHILVCSICLPQVQKKVKISRLLRRCQVCKSQGWTPEVGWRCLLWYPYSWAECRTGLNFQGWQSDPPGRRPSGPCNEATPLALQYLDDTLLNIAWSRFRHFGGLWT